MTTSRPAPLLLSLLLALSLLAGPASAQGDRAIDIEVPPDCRIHIEVPPPLTAQKTADLNAVADAIRAALRDSADMRTKVADACAQNDGVINIVPLRDSSRVFIGQALLDNDPRLAVVDLGDIESAPMFLSGGTAADRQAVADGMLTRFLAHEIDHLRDRPRERHLDPPANRANRETGAGVDDANMVLDETGNDTVRLQYAAVGVVDGNRTLVTTFRVNGRTVVWDTSAHQDHARQQRRQRGAGRSRAVLEDPMATFAHPNRPCQEGEDPEGANCWPLLVDLDADLDTILDGEDNCQGIWNPGQGDQDLDGAGDACDHDADGDGFVAGTEEGLGSSDLKVQSTPETWTLPSTCANGVDDDGDGLIDEADASCAPPSAYSGQDYGLPLVDDLINQALLAGPPGDPLGGVLPFSAGCGLTLTSPEGQTIEVELEGAGVLVPNPIVGEGIDPVLPVDLGGLRLTGVLPDGQPIIIQPPPLLPPFGQLIADDPGQPAFFPGQLDLDLFLQITIGDQMLFNHQPIVPSPIPLGTFPGGLLLPPDPQMAGLELHTQALVLDPSSSNGMSPRGGTESGWVLESFSLDADPISNVLAGAGRVETAAAVARTLDAADTVLIARADDYPDALAGAPLAVAMDAPILLTGRNALADPVVSEILRLGATRAIILGGEGAVAADVATALADLGLAVERLAGESRFDTAAAIAERLAEERGVAELPQAYITEGADADPARGWPDALSTSALAAAQGRPILMVDTDRLPDATADALASLGVTEATIVGGTAAVSDEVADAITAGGVAVERVAGDSRYGTSAAMAQRALDAGAQTDRVWLATGLSFPDALVAGPAAGRDNALLLLINGSSLTASPETREVLAGLAPIDATVFLGGPAAISEEVRDQVGALP